MKLCMIIPQYFIKCIDNTYIIAIIFLFLLCILLYLYIIINEKNTKIQLYLTKIYDHNKIIKNTYSKFINQDYKIIINDQIIYIENFLNYDFFYDLQKTFNDTKYETINNIFRKGNGISFLNLHKHKDYYNLLSLYYSEELILEINKILNIYLQRLSLNDNNACSLLIYTNKGDYIDWHYDISSLYGKRYTLLLTLINKNNITNELSENEFIYKLNNVENKIKLKENSLILFEGNKVLHKSTPINNNEKRIIFSMVLCDVCQTNNNLPLKLYDMIKDNTIYKN